MEGILSLGCDQTWSTPASSTTINNGLSHRKKSWSLVKSSTPYKSALTWKGGSTVILSRQDPTKDLDRHEDVCTKATILMSVSWTGRNFYRQQSTHGVIMGLWSYYRDDIRPTMIYCLGSSEQWHRRLRIQKVAWFWGTAVFIACGKQKSTK